MTFTGDPWPSPTPAQLVTRRSRLEPPADPFRTGDKLLPPPVRTSPPRQMAGNAPGLMRRSSGVWSYLSPRPVTIVGIPFGIAVADFAVFQAHNPHANRTLTVDVSSGSSPSWRSFTGLASASR